MVNRPKIKGTSFETLVVKALQRAGWKHAERRALNGATDKGDIAGVAGVVIECKNVNKLAFGPWLREAHTEAHNANADFGVLWAKRRGYSEAEDGFVVMSGETFMRLLKGAGYQ